MQLYIAFDVHSSSSVVAVVDEDGKRLFSKKVRNDPETVVKILRPLPGEVVGVSLRARTTGTG